MDSTFQELYPWAEPYVPQRPDGHYQLSLESFQTSSLHIFSNVPAGTNQNAIFLQPESSLLNRLQDPISYAPDQWLSSSGFDFMNGPAPQPQIGPNHGSIEHPDPSIAHPHPQPTPHPETTFILPIDTFPPLITHQEHPPPSSTAFEQFRTPTIRSKDAYNPLYVRTRGAIQDGWCGYCPRGAWFAETKPGYSDHMANIHGVTPVNKAAIPAPRTVQMLVPNRLSDREGVERASVVGRQFKKTPEQVLHGQCEMCGKWVKLKGRARATGGAKKGGAAGGEGASGGDTGGAGGPTYCNLWWHHYHTGCKNRPKWPVAQTWKKSELGSQVDGDGSPERRVRPKTS